MNELIARLKAIASENYERGGDVFVECYDDADWLEFIEGCGDIDPIQMLHDVMSIHAERQHIAEMCWNW